MSRPSLDGCLGFGWLAFWMVVFLTVPLYCEHRSGEGDDPYFRTAHCAHRHDADQVAVTRKGLSPTGCVRTRHQSFRFVNRLQDRPVTLCLGLHGVCATGHDSPIGSVTLRPGQSRKLRFPYHRSWWWYEGVPRNYPVTLLPVPGLTFGATDIVVRSEVPLSD